MTVSDLIEQLQQFHGHETVFVRVDTENVVDLLTALQIGGKLALDVQVSSVEPSSSPQTGTIAKLYLE